ncbi:type II secretion system protein [Bordetella genomosp. 11]|uniref:Bacterial shufflon protein N-terminal domain-containing protein n=1 Tax=Bordetella genomosp. 11 TaxID=1416808 RepID=A0A261UD27_9BORD|nr:type II secretion system protein [Bordetella genomosp. 11]OZI59824.1 hypothetical protein CAL28_10035 [Bordetella genomosp. 11]
MSALHPACTHGGVRAQRGFALLELTIAVAIACVLAVWAANRLVRDVEGVAERAAGLWLLDIRRALDGMLARHGDTLADGGALVDDHGGAVYADPWAPTLSELKAQGHLAGAVPEHGPLGMRVAIKLWRDGDCPGAGCRIEALAYTGVFPPAASRAAASVLPDPTRLAGVLMAAGGAGASVSELAPDRLRGAAFDLPNPPAPGMAALPIGTVAVRAGREAADAHRYLRARDARDPQFRGDVSTAGTLSSRRLVAGEHLKLDGKAVPGEPCPENGLLARDTDGSLLNCVAGTWAPPGGFGGAYATNTGTGCDMPGRSAPNPRTGACSCPPGYRAVMVASGGERDADVGWTEGYVCLR